MTIKGPHVKVGRPMGSRGGLGPLHWAPGIEWITESSRVVFKELIGLGVATTTLVLFLPFYILKDWTVAQ